jgi:hypothetical protein
MNRTLTPRERWLLTAVPALAILAVYLFGFYRPQQKLLADTRAALAVLQDKRVAPFQLALQRQTLRDVEDRVDLLSRNLPSPTAAKQLVPTAGAGPCGEAQAMARITGIFGRRGVVVVSCTRLADADVSSAMPVGLGELLTRTAGPGANAGCVAGTGSPSALAGGVWRVRTVGRFADVQKSLEAMAADNELAVPLGIAMEPSEDGQTHPWSLWVWM